ncbi:MAG TPA: UbiA family prenyltransferase [Thioploca sp.]|nr:MAG: UbiA family prenyltransferase [Gammaproteobacteria bacterium]HDN27089.1 UbiA family prenyltransferase [Thioploca sp.]
MNSKRTLNPLCIDLDGTLIATDTLWESVLLLLRQHFWRSFLLPIWLIKGKAYFKYKIAQDVTLDVATLPYRENVLAFLQQEKNNGRTLVLATAATQKIAQAVAGHLGLFNDVIASDAHTNMKGTTKRDTLKQRFGAYSYMGDSNADLPILQAAHEAFLVAPSAKLLKQTQCPPERVFSAPKPRWLTWLKALRPHQWIKNGLIFLPLVLAHQLLNLTKLENALLAFIAFSLAASAGYVLNDLLDLAADRAHRSKKHRPFASGLLPIHYGLPLFAVLVSLSFFVSLRLPGSFTGMLGLYLLMTMSYSFYLKQKLMVDILVLAGLYTHRILAGGIAVAVPISSWLLAFSMFIFMSLAFLKRYVELLQQHPSRKAIKNRGYEVDDIEMLASMGPTSGYIAVLVFALYVSSETTTRLYHSPFILWIICPILLYWISRIWFLAHRQQMLDDPVQFALTDKMSWLVVACIIALVLLAKFF